jgi:hypothetical protein
MKITILPTGSVCVSCIQLTKKRTLNSIDPLFFVLERETVLSVRSELNILVYLEERPSSIGRAKIVFLCAL